MLQAMVAQALMQPIYLTYFAGKILEQWLYYYQIIIIPGE